MLFYVQSIRKLTLVDFVLNKTQLKLSADGKNFSIQIFKKLINLDKEVRPPEKVKKTLYNTLKTTNQTVRSRRRCRSSR